MAAEIKNLVRRIAHLVKEKSELLNINEGLVKQNEELIEQNIKYQEIISKISPKKLREGETIHEQSRHSKFRMVTVLFASISGFKNISENMDSSLLMDELDEIYMQFGKIIKKYNVQKIKTIGDTFMCAGGIPHKNITNPIDVVMAALEMQDVINKLPLKNGNKKIWDIKLGIHTGSVIAQVTGKRKVSYEIKGDTVNIASRMESNSEHGQINVSLFTYDLIKEFFICEYFGKIPVKYKRDLEIYNVKGLQPELCAKGESIVPNKNYRTRFSLIQFTDIQEIILDRLEKELPKFLFYHNVKHTVDVVTQTELIGWGEGVSDEELLLLKTAALFHDTGHVIDYDKHEYYSTELVKEYLLKYGYTQEQIKIISELIWATKLPPKPKNKLEEIICDSDLDYLGRSDMIPVSETLYRELKEQNKIGTLNDWNKLQLKFINGHQYFTKTARSLREVNKQKQIERLKQLINETE